MPMDELRLSSSTLTSSPSYFLIEAAKTPKRKCISRTATIDISGLRSSSPPIFLEPKEYDLRNFRVDKGHSFFKSFKEKVPALDKLILRTKTQGGNPSNFFKMEGAIIRELMTSIHGHDDSRIRIIERVGFNMYYTTLLNLAKPVSERPWEEGTHAVGTPDCVETLIFKDCKVFAVKIEKQFSRCAVHIRDFVLTVVRQSGDGPQDLRERLNNAFLEQVEARWMKMIPIEQHNAKNDPHSCHIII